MSNPAKRHDVIGRLSVFTAVPSRLSVKNEKYLEPLQEWLRSELGVEGRIITNSLVITNTPENIKRLAEAKTMVNLYQGLFPVDVETAPAFVDVRYY